MATIQATRAPILAPLPAAWREHLAETTADAVIQDPGAYPPALLALQVRIIAHPNLTGRRLADAWEAYCQARERAAGFESGMIDWDEIEADLTGLDRDADAADIIRQEVEDTRDLLLLGR